MKEKEPSQHNTDHLLNVSKFHGEKELNYYFFLYVLADIFLYSYKRMYEICR